MRTAPVLPLLALALAALPACRRSGTGSDSSTGADAAPGTDAAATDAATTTCTMLESPVAGEGWMHVTEGSVITYAHNPPAGGPHYPIWARYMAFTAAIPRGYWVHNIEHGAIVLLYRPDADPTLIAALNAAYAAIPDDPMCGHPRALLTPDPDLDDVIAVSANGFVLEADCVDEPTILAFVTAHRNMAPENVCASGTYP